MTSLMLKYIIEYRERFMRFMIFSNRSIFMLPPHTAMLILTTATCVQIASATRHHYLFRKNCSHERTTMDRPADIGGYSKG